MAIIWWRFLNLLHWQFFQILFLLKNCLRNSILCYRRDHNSIQIAKFILLILALEDFVGLRGLIRKICFELINIPYIIFHSVLVNELQTNETFAEIFVNLDHRFIWIELIFWEIRSQVCTILDSFAFFLNFIVDSVNLLFFFLRQIKVFWVMLAEFMVLIGIRLNIFKKKRGRDS